MTQKGLTILARTSQDIKMWKSEENEEGYRQRDRQKTDRPKDLCSKFVFAEKQFGLRLETK